VITVCVLLATKTTHSKNFSGTIFLSIFSLKFQKIAFTSYCRNTKFGRKTVIFFGPRLSDLSFGLTMKKLVKNVFCFYSPPPVQTRKEKESKWQSFETNFPFLVLSVLDFMKAPLANVENTQVNYYIYVNKDAICIAKEIDFLILTSTHKFLPTTVP
jgi:hypothetical protein